METPHYKYIFNLIDDWVAILRKPPSPLVDIHKAWGKKVEIISNMEDDKRWYKSVGIVDAIINSFFGHWMEPSGCQPLDFIR